jgi:hypothetical protein
MVDFQALNLVGRQFPFTYQFCRHWAADMATADSTSLTVAVFAKLICGNVGFSVKAATVHGSPLYISRLVFTVMIF